MEKLTVDDCIDVIREAKLELACEIETLIVEFNKRTDYMFVGNLWVDIDRGSNHHLGYDVRVELAID